MSPAEIITLDHLELTRLFFAVVLLLISAHFFGYLFHRFQLPKVIGEITGGLILGPSCLGYIFPESYGWIFNAYPTEGKLLSEIYWFGLIFLMFISGFEIDKSYEKEDKKTVIAILIGATVVPFFAGWQIPNYYDFTPYIGVKNNITALKLVIGIAVAVTSIPVISKIFIDLDIINTRFAKIVIAAATIQDILLYVALSIATGLVINEGINKYQIINVVLITFVFFIISLFVMPKIIRFISGMRYNLLIKSSLSGYGLFICFLFVALASILKVNIVFGAFLAGIIIGKLPEENIKPFKKHIKDISLAFFIPVYFAIVGLKIDVIKYFDFKFFAFFLVFTTLFEAAGTFIAAKINKKDNLSGINLSVAMNARGGPGIVLATVAFDLGIINQTFFVSLVLIAIITSLLAGWWFKFILSKNLPLLK